MMRTESEKDRQKRGKVLQICATLQGPSYMQSGQTQFTSTANTFSSGNSSHPASRFPDALNQLPKLSEVDDMMLMSILKHLRE